MNKPFPLSESDLDFLEFVLELYINDFKTLLKNADEIHTPMYNESIKKGEKALNKVYLLHKFLN